LTLVDSDRTCTPASTALGARITTMQHSNVRAALPAIGAGDAPAAEQILRVLATRGVRAAFGVPGGLISSVYDALAAVPQIGLVSTRHENMAGFAAMGHAIATGAPAIVLTTSGPGITNAITAMAAAASEEIPMIVIAGEVGTSATTRAAFQDSSSNAMDAVAMMRTIARYSARVEDAAAAPGMAAHALRMATGSKPGPVFLSLPINVGNTRARAIPLSMHAAEAPLAPDPEACAIVARELLRARMPLLVLGNGARFATDAIRELAERTCTPVVTTAHAKGAFPETHPLHLGLIGFGGHPSATQYLAGKPDAVCVIGSRLGDFATDGWAAPIGGTRATFQIDRDPLLVGRNYPVTLGIVADARAAVQTILAALPLDVRRRIREQHARTYVRPESITSDASPLKPARVLAALQLAFPDALFTSDIGEHCAHAAHYLVVDDPSRFRAMLGIASMGTGIGVAMGARHARRDRPVVCICGDGGFAMHAGDLLTCVESGIDVVLAVMNDGRWNMVHHGFRAVYGKQPDALAERVADLAAVARGFGAIGERIERASDLAPERLRSLAGLGRPVVLDVRIDPDDALSIGTRSAAVRRSAFGGSL
jgi:acetolactate synthase-1/2/3 large subunit